MAKYNNITLATTTTLTPKAKGKGSVRSIHITNNSTYEATATIFIDDGTDQFYFIKNLVIPTGVAVLLDDSIPFDSTTYNLKITNTGTSPDLTVILR